MAAKEYHLNDIIIQKVATLIKLNTEEMLI